MKLRIPFCLPFIHDPRTVDRVVGAMCRLPFVDEVSVRIFRRRAIRRMRDPRCAPPLFPLNGD